MVVGAGGSATNRLYLPHLVKQGVTTEQLVLVEPHAERSAAVAGRYEGAETYKSLETALGATTKQLGHIVIASSTAAHGDNIRAIVSASREGAIDLNKTKIWCEKPVTDPADFENVLKLAEETPGLDISVGYILRFSGILRELQQSIEDKKLTISGIDWQYGKDRRTDERPTQGVLADEVVHPLSVTDWILQSSFGADPKAYVMEAKLQSRPFVNEDAQREAQALNKDIPLQPISDVSAEIEYVCEDSVVPVTLNASFLMESNVRRATIRTRDLFGCERTLVLDFDVKNAAGTQVDRLRLENGSADGVVLAEWAGDKAALQMKYFLGSSAVSAQVPSPLTNLGGEARIQHQLQAIEHAARMQS